MVVPLGLISPLPTDVMDDFKVNVTDVFSAKTNHAGAYLRGPLAMHWCNVEVLIELLPKNKLLLKLTTF